MPAHIVSLLPSNPGGAVPAGVQRPSTHGFNNATVQPARGGLAVCVSGFVPVTASTTKNIKFNYPLPKNQSQVTETLLESITSGSTASMQIMEGMESVNGTYDIAATLCIPANSTAGKDVKGVQLLTHGIGFDRHYWDFAPGYSYVDVAAQYNYATFFYDRLGVGESSKPDFLTVQSPLEVEIANCLATSLRQGHFSNLTFSKVVGAGHSFGSIITQAITAQYPSSLDAAILTGFSANSTAMPVFLQANNFAIASHDNPYRFSTLSNGYLAASSIISNQIAFFRAPNFDPQVLSLADATKGTVTLGELFSTTAVTEPAKNWTKPVAVVNGDNDLPFCFGNCSYPTNLAQGALTMLYPATKKTGTYLAPTTGHGLNLHYTAVEAYHYIQDFLNKNGV
ncbi:hypothetical protein PRZ48_000267 [Zasmidium cellare]|uniref:AB hydrolase-1 domain-containing protein n=1 Tax=Zasmidium cellare TaxID=395010 RepID=A0ABR0EZQ3_ZASCE|nr:hypothetical protein PRZ48_000267 [Zasmidium cellare]